MQKKGTILKLLGLIALIAFQSFIPSISADGGGGGGVGWWFETPLPENQEITAGNNAQHIDWSFACYQESYWYSVFDNGVNMTTFGSNLLFEQIESYTLQYNLNYDLKGGWHNITCILSTWFWDFNMVWMLFYLSDMVEITVNNPAPSPTHPDDLTLPLDASGVSIEWTITDATTLNPQYNITYGYSSYTTMIDASWTTPISFSLDGKLTTLGIFSVTLAVADGFGAYASDQVTIIVNDLPTSNHPSDITDAVIAETGLSIVWELTDSYLSDPKFNITYGYGTPYSTTSESAWTGTGIPYGASFDLDGYLTQVGTFKVFLNVHDGYGYVIALDEVEVIVSSGMIIDHPSDQIVYQNQLNQKIIWTITDDSVADLGYAVVNTPTGDINIENWVQIGTTNQYTITVDIYMAIFGNYDYDLTAYDGIGDSISDSVFITMLAFPMSVKDEESDLACGFGSERFGITIDYNFKEITTIYVLIQEIGDIDGDLIYNENYSAIGSATGLNGEGSIKIILKILYNEVGSLGWGDSGILYRYLIWTNTDCRLIKQNIGLYHWSRFAEDNTVDWDQIPTDLLPTTDYTVYIRLFYWNKDTKAFYNVINGDSQIIDVHEQLSDLLAKSDSSITLSVPSVKSKVLTSYTMEAWITTWRTGYYKFTYIAPTDATDSWLERIGCPPEFVELGDC